MTVLISIPVLMKLDPCVNFQECSLCACALLNLPVPPNSWLGRGQYITMQEPLRDYPTLRLQLSGQMAWPRLFEVRNADRWQCKRPICSPFSFNGNTSPDCD